MSIKKKIDLAKTILCFIGVAGGVSLLTFFPGLAKIIPVTRTRRSLYVGVVNQALKRLQNRGLVKITENNGIKVISLTDQGMALMNKIELCKARIKIPKRWDGKWRIVIFDVKEKNKAVRDRLRETLRGLGFKRLQHSVWIYPYPCDEIVELTKRSYELGRNVLYFSSDRFPGDYPFVRLFGFHHIKD